MMNKIVNQKLFYIPHCLKQNKTINDVATKDIDNYEAMNYLQQSYYQSHNMAFYC